MFLIVLNLQLTKDICSVTQYDCQLKKLQKQLKCGFIKIQRYRSMIK